MSITLGPNQVVKRKLIPYCQLSLAELEIDEHRTAEARDIKRSH